MKRGLAVLFLLALAVPGTAAAAGTTEVVVALGAPPLGEAAAASRTLTAAAKRRRLDLRTPASVAYVRSLAAAQRALEARIERAIPGAHVRRRYAVVVNGLAVELPRGALARLERLPGVARVYPSVRYRARLDRTPGLIGAPALWGSDFAWAGNGVKIAILDDGVDHTHPFFDPRGFTRPAGFPKGTAAYTTAKVIVARSFPPRRPAWRHAAKPFDPEHSEHGTHVAGIAAGNRTSVPGLGALSGVAPNAYLGNYRVLTIPTASGVGLDGNAPEIAAGIEAAVKDGMDVINLSIGEPEIELSRDLVVDAIAAAARAGVVTVVAAGNDFGEFGAGSVGSPGSAPDAITVAALAGARAQAVASFSAGGPTPISLQLKPDVAAPGSAVLSAVPVRAGGWDRFSGTSMASPHVAGAVALLRQRHPDWTPAQVKSALVQTADVLGVGATRVGTGRANLVRADAPRVFATPASVSFGLLRPGASATRTVELADGGGGAGTWQVSAGPGIEAPASVEVPGTLELRVRAAAEELAGYVVLRQGADERRIAYWAGVSAARLAGHRATRLARPGVYRSTTAGRPALVDAYRYPAAPGGAGVSGRLAGPERVYRVRVTRPVENFGVVVLGRRRGVRVEPRTVVAGDEARQVGYASLPLNLNPYLEDFLQPRAVSGAVRPAPGAYDVVFDSPTPGTAGAFTFRFWMNDVTPPRLRLRTRTVARHGALLVTATDAGSGVDARSIRATVDGSDRVATLAGRSIRIPVGGLPRGTHRLVLQVSDFQETRNQENVPAILPNTTRLAVAFRVR